MRRASGAASAIDVARLRLTPFERGLAAASLAGLAIGFVIGLWTGGVAQSGLLALVLALVLAADMKLIPWPDGLTRPFIDAGVGLTAALLALGLILSLPGEGRAPAAFWFGVAALWLAAWLLVERLASGYPAQGRLVAAAAPAIFGVTLVLLWELVARGGDVPQIILPPPSMIAARFVGSAGILWADFQETFLRSVLIGYAMGCGAGFVAAVAIDRSPFLKRGLLPIGNLFSALPIIGLAPITVIWFGFDWPSRAAVVVAMTFFPMLVNTVAGLDSADRMQRDLMRTYAAPYSAELLKLRLPAALPLIFNALKINSTLALIGAIVAEFFGSPTVGIGFRISSEAGRLNLDMVWAAIVVSALAGVAFYAAVTFAERAATFWHPSMRT